MDEKTTEEIANIFSSAHLNVDLINNKSTQHELETEQEWKDRIKRNVRHLEIIKEYKKTDGLTSIWTTEDFSEIDTAILKGKLIYE
tara:strand:+ start:553 stop:810 length:258 start_codon:yes stop_codon:yes gene_type:complete